MDSPIMALALRDEVMSRARPSSNWETDFDRLQQQAEIYEMKQAIKAAVTRIAQVFRRPTSVLRAVRA